MKISWGTKIAALYISFVVMIIGLVAATFRQPSQLVSTNYYEQETNFNQRMQAQQAAAKLSAPVDMKLDQEAVTLQFPAEQINEHIKGEAYFYSVADVSGDRRFPFDIVSEGHCRLPRTSLPKGKYELQLQWTANGTTYFQSRNLLLD